MTDITIQFIKAVEALNAKGVTMRQLCDSTGIDRRNLSRMISSPAEHYPRPAWLTSICEVFAVSPDFLILDKGCIFSDERKRAARNAD